jgi:hypothetical protein
VAAGHDDDDEPIELDPPVDLRDPAPAFEGARHEIVTALVISRMAIATLRDQLVELPPEARDHLLDVLDHQTRRLQSHLEQLVNELDQSGG